MKKKSWHLDRRTFLRGVGGISLGLPFLNCMMAHGEEKALKELPRRAAFIFFPNGVSLPGEKDHQFEDWHWFPKGKGRNYEFRKSQDHLNPYRKDISVISGLCNPLNNGTDPHVAPSAFLTTKKIAKTDLYNSISIDQKIIEFQKEKTLMDSMVLSTAGGVGNMTRAFTLSYDKQGKGIPALSNLRDVYEQMYQFSSAAGKARLKKKDHLLNEILQDAKNIKRNLGKEDQYTMEEYLSSVNDLEKKVAGDKVWASLNKKQKPPTHIDLNIDRYDVENYIQGMYELMYLAFKADITRVATYQMASEGASPVANLSKYIGLKKDLHAFSHTATKSKTGYEDWAAWDRFVAKQLAFLIKKLKDTPEGDGSLLDRCLIFQGSAQSYTHNTTNFPLIMAGGTKLGHKAGQFVSYKKEKHFSNLLVGIANCVGAPIEKFGDSTGNPMSELFG